jgi:hypothetical protein
MANKIFGWTLAGRICRRGFGHYICPSLGPIELLGFYVLSQTIHPPLCQIIDTLRAVVLTESSELPTSCTYGAEQGLKECCLVADGYCKHALTVIHAFGKNI